MDVPNFINENPQLEAVNLGLNIAENERREAASGVDPFIDETDGLQGDEPVAPEVAALHEEP